MHGIFFIMSTASFTHVTYKWCVCVCVYRARENAVHRLRLVDRALTEQSPFAITPEHPGEPGSPWGPPMHGRQMGSEESLSPWEPVSSAVKQAAKWHVAGRREARSHTDGCPQWALRGHPVPQVAHIITQPVLTTIRIPILEVRKVGCRKTRKLAPNKLQCGDSSPDDQPAALVRPESCTRRQHRATPDPHLQEQKGKKETYKEIKAALKITQ